MDIPKILILQHRLFAKTVLISADNKVSLMWCILEWIFFLQSLVWLPSFGSIGLICKEKTIELSAAKMCIQFLGHPVYVNFNFSFYSIYPIIAAPYYHK